jgi:hypothetical protein
MLRRATEVVVATCAVAGLALSVWLYFTTQDASSAPCVGGVNVLTAIQADLARHAELQRELQQARFVERGEGAIESYLAKIRRDGLPAHDDMKQKLVALARLNTEVVALADVYELHARTPALRLATKEFSRYAIVWNDRWESVPDYFMAGGKLPAATLFASTDLAAAVDAELALLRRE